MTICTLILLGVVLLSTLVMHVGVQKYSLADALFRTISVMATGADMHEADFPTPGMKVFVSSLRITGAALTWGEEVYFDIPVKVPRTASGTSG